MKILIFCSIILMTLRLFCTTPDSLFTSEPESEIIILPFGFYTTETSLALGVFGQYKIDQDKKIFGNLIYTFKNQFMTFFIAEWYLGEMVFYNKSKIKKYYSESYGIGNETEKDNVFSYKYDQLEIYTETGKEIKKHFTVNLAVDNFLHKVTDNNDSLSIYYSEDKYQIANGTGISLNYDDVKDSFFRDGKKIFVSWLIYPDFLSNVTGFSVLNAEAAFYRSFNQSAINILLTYRKCFDFPHPEKLSGIGGSRILRGYPDRRFRDMNSASFQAQYDLRLYKKIAVSIFGGIGDVFNSYNDLSLNNIKSSYGGGLLYDFKGLAVRAQVAGSPENDIQIIVTGNRAF